LHNWFPPRAAGCVEDPVSYRRGITVRRPRHSRPLTKERPLVLAVAAFFAAAALLCAALIVPVLWTAVLEMAFSPSSVAIPIPHL
jgi:hypothetical protein